MEPDYFHSKYECTAKACASSTYYFASFTAAVLDPIETFQLDCRTLIEGDAKAGLSIFWADDGLDTGPVILQRECDVLEDDTLDSLYKRFMYPEGIKATVTIPPWWCFLEGSTGLIR